MSQKDLFRSDLFCLWHNTYISAVKQNNFRGSLCYFCDPKSIDLGLKMYFSINQQLFLSGLKNIFLEYYIILPEQQMPVRYLYEQLQPTYSEASTFVSGVAKWNSFPLDVRGQRTGQQVIAVVCFDIFIIMHVHYPL